MDCLIDGGGRCLVLEGKVGCGGEQVLGFLCFFVDFWSDGVCVVCYLFLLLMEGSIFYMLEKGFEEFLVEEKYVFCKFLYLCEL